MSRQKTKDRRQKTRVLIICAALLLCASNVWAQGPVAPSQSTTPRQQDNPPSDARIGVDAAKRVSLTMREAILMALENNRDIEVERLNVQMNEFDVRAAQGVYDPALSATLFYDRRTLPVTTIFAAGKTDSLAGSAALTQRLLWQGSSIQGNFDNNRAGNDNPFNTINPQITNNLSFTFTQPILRNRRIDQFRRQITIAKQRLDISDAQFRQRAIEIIASVQRAYWDLIFARRDREIKRESVELALTQLASNERLVEAGSLAPADIIAARVELERRNDEAAAAVDAIQRAENSLKALMLQPNNGEMWNAELQPVEQPRVDTSAALPLADATRLAFQNRPEMEQFRLRGELNKTDVEFFRDQTKPQLDFFASYGTLGLAGTQRVGENPITLSSELSRVRTNALITRVNGLTPGLPPIDLVPPSMLDVTPDFLLGSYGQSFLNLLSNDFRSFRFGVNISLPLRNRTAEANLGRALAEGRQIDVQRQRVQQQIEVEVRNGLQAVVTAIQRVEAAQNSRSNAELQLQSEQRKFEAGQSTNFFVLDRQNALSAARGRELRALTDYTKAIAELQRALSTTLSSNNVTVK